jgi:hypothetical protein
MPVVPPCLGCACHSNKNPPVMADECWQGQPHSCEDASTCADWILSALITVAAPARASWDRHHNTDLYPVRPRDSQAHSAFTPVSGSHHFTRLSEPRHLTLTLPVHSLCCLGLVASLPQFIQHVNVRNLRICDRQDLRSCVPVLSEKLHQHRWARNLYACQIRVGLL